MQKTTNSLLFILIKEKKYLYSNKSLMIKIYFILIFGKETNKCLAY